MITDLAIFSGWLLEGCPAVVLRWLQRLATEGSMHHQVHPNLAQTG
jgi:hypothetical protein